VEAQEVLHSASILGPEFDLGVLLAVGEQPEATVLDGLDAALAAGLLTARTGGRTERYAFSHALIQQALYDELPPHRRRRQHWRVGEALEHERGGRPEVWALLAHHFLAGGESRRAIHYALLAGDHAAGLYAAAEAAHQYQTALDLLLEEGDATGAAEARRKLGGALHDLGRREEALAAYALAREAFAGLGDALGQARVHRDIAGVHRLVGDLTAAWPHLERALALWPPGREDGELARLLLDALPAYQSARTPADEAAAGALVERGLALTERLGGAALQARALLELALRRRAARAESHTVLSLLDEAEAAARQAGDLGTLDLIYTRRADEHWLAGDRAAALADRRLQLAVCEQMGRPTLLANATIELAMTCMEAGEWAEARALLRKARALDPQMWAHAAAWALATLEGHRDAALALLHERVAEGRRRRNSPEMLWGLVWLAAWAIWERRPEEAEARLQELGPLGLASELLASELYVVALLAEVRVQCGSPEAEDAVAEAERHMEQVGAGDMRPVVLRARGLLLRRQGDLDGALRALQASAAVARAPGNVLELGVTLADLEEAAWAQGATAMAVAAEAERRALVERIGPEIRHLGWFWANPTP
jgi:predicted ATPase